MNNGNGNDLPAIAGDPMTDAERLADAHGKITEQLKAIEPITRIATSVMLNGVLATTRGVDVAAVLSSIAYQAGNQIASSITGDLATLMQLRKAFQEAFCEGVRKAPMNQQLMGKLPPGIRSQG